LIAAGAQIVGGCCGTTPEHISYISKLIKPI
jgi:methionine synthase I (cobalamin-dependent)